MEQLTVPQRVHARELWDNEVEELVQATPLSDQEGRHDQVRRTAAPA